MTYRRHENFDRLMENLSRVGQGRNVQLGDLFHPDFMRRHSNFATFDALVEATGKTFSGESEMVAYLQSDDWNQHVRRSTRFGSWLEMEQVGAAENTQAELMKGLR